MVSNFNFEKFCEFYTRSLQQCLMNPYVQVLWNYEKGFYLVAAKDIPVGTVIQDQTEIIELDDWYRYITAFIFRYGWRSQNPDNPKVRLLGGICTLATPQVTDNNCMYSDSVINTAKAIAEGEEITMTFGKSELIRYEVGNPINNPFKVEWIAFQEGLIKEYHIQVKYFSVRFKLAEHRYADTPQALEILDKRYEQDKRSYERQKSSLEAQMRRQEANVAQTKARLAQLKENFDDDKSDYEREKAHIVEQNSKD